MLIQANMGEFMKIEIKYSGGILNLPSSVSDLALIADENQLRVLLCMLSYAQHFADFDASLPLLQEKMDLSLDEIKGALAFWSSNGVLSIDGLEMAVTDAVQAETVKQNRQPTYTGKQILTYVERNDDFRALCNECQAILGKSFTACDYNNILQLKSYYKFSDEYILLLLVHCVEIEKTSWAYIRKTASNLYDEGITSYSKLEEHFSARKNKRSLEYKIRKLLGIGDREFTKREKEIFEKWIELKLNIDLIKKAYEITIEKTGKPSCAYMAKILENWHSSGIRTVEDVESSEKQYKKKQEMVASTFDTDDFFEAALARSNEELKKGKNKK